MIRLPRDLRYSLTLRYTAALILVGVLVLIGHFASQAITTQITDHMRLIRVAEKEALLTDELTKTLLSMQVAQKPSQLQSLRSLISSSVDRLVKVHKFFNDEAKGASLESYLHPHFDAVESRFTEFQEHYRAFQVEVLEPDRVDPQDFSYAKALEGLTAATTALGASLANLAEVSEQNNMARMSVYKRLNLLLALSILGLLLIEAFFVFRPAVRRMDDALAARSEFLGRVSHEIRNPMNAIIGMSSVMKETKLTQQQKKYLSNLDGAAETLLGMLNNLLDFRALEKEKVSLTTTEFNFVQMLERCADLASTNAHTKNVELTIILDSGVPCFLVGDEHRLQQVIINLLGNAVKFTEEGYVTLKVEKIAERDSYLDLRFLIKDTGIGIEAEKLHNVFESFFQENSSIRKKYGGSGLGLTIVHDLVLLMGGRIDVKSQKGHGSLFIVDLTLAKADLEREILTPNLTDISLDFISGDAQWWRYASLEVAGARVNALRYPVDSKALTEKLTLLDDSVDPETLIATAESVIRSGNDCIVSLKTTFSHEKIEALKRVGVKNFLFKPLKSWEFENFLRARGEPAIESDFLEEASAEHRLLLVDDSEDNLTIMSRLLSGMNWQANTFLDGEAAFVELQTKKYDAVLVDIEMPGWDGRKLLSELRAWESEQGKEPTRVIAVTGHSDREGEGFDFSEFDGYIQKPVDRAKIQEALGQIYS